MSIEMWKWKSLSHVQLFFTPWTVCSPGQNTGVGSYSFLQGIFPTQGSNPGLLHCRQILYCLSHQGSPHKKTHFPKCPLTGEWVKTMYIKWNIIQHLEWRFGHKLQRESESCSVVTNSLWPHGLCSPWNSLGQNTGVGSLSLLQGIFPTQGSNPGLLHCRQILYQLSYRGSQ